MFKRFTLLALIFVGVLLVAPRQLRAQTPELVREEFHQTFPFTSNGRISLDNIQGTVKIQAWDRNEVKIDAVKTAYSRELLNDAQIKVSATADILRIHTEYPDGNLSFNEDKDGDYRHYKNPASVDYTLSVPRNSRLNSIELVNGSLEIDGVAGDVNASCVNGKVTTRNLMGNIKLGSVNGGLEAIFSALTEGKSISLGSVNGSLVVTIPSDSNTTVKAGTVHGRISNDFGLPVREGDYVGRELYGQIGRGGAKLKLGNVNGAITIYRASDGRSLSPATSLLNSGEESGSGENAGKGKNKHKTKGNEDLEDEVDAPDRDGSDIGQEARRAAREAQREAVRAKREAQRAQAEAQRALAEAQRAVAEAQREARQEGAEAARETQTAAAEVAAEAQREAREAQREVVRTVREVARAATRKVRQAGDVYSDGHYRLVERDSSRFIVTASPRISIETFDGTVSVHGWDKQEVVVNVVKRAANEQAMKGVRFNAVNDGNQIKIVATFDKALAQRIADGVTTVNANVNLEIFVPRSVALRVSSGDGHLSLDGINGDVDLVTADGSIDVVEGSGKILVRTGDGRIRIMKFDGVAEATTGDGRITLEGRFAQLMARTGDGSITLMVPSGFDAIIETDAESVVNQSDLVITEEPSSSKKLHRWKVGNGGPVLNLRTGDGKIILRRAGTQ